MKMEADQESYKCEWCGKLYDVYFDLDRHMLIHGPDDPHYQCDICGDECKTEKGLKKHSLMHISDNDEYFCDICDEFCRSEAELDTHMLTHDLNESFQCNICGKSFTLESDLERHNMLNHDDESETANEVYRCQFCNRSYSKQLGLSRHIAIAHNNKIMSDKGVKCPLCDKFIMWRRNLGNHIKNFHKDVSASSKNVQLTKMQISLLRSHLGNYDCETCGRHFNSKRKFTYHVQSHKYQSILTKSLINKKSQKLNCEFCGRRFFRRYHVNRHICYYHTDRQKNNFVCDICDVSFHLESKLDEHMMDHTVKPPMDNFKCIACGELFRFSRSLLKHMKELHGKEMAESKWNYMCKVCGKGFNSGIGLSNHSRWHVKCGAAISKKHVSPQISAPKKRVLVHKEHAHDQPKSDVKSKVYRCGSCAKSFSYSKSLKRHMKFKHVNTYSCDMCKKAFHSKSNLEQHMMLHYTEVPQNNFTCDICSKLFDSLQSLASHIRSHKLDNHSSPSSHQNNDSNDGERTHSDTKTKHKYNCETCKKNFLTSQGLQSHLRSHQRGKIFHSTAIKQQKKTVACPTCGKTFKNSSGLGSHIRMHKYSSNFNKFATKDNKNIQTMVDTEVPLHRVPVNFSCKQCGKHFLRKSNLSLHIQTTHIGRIESFSCNICDVTFSLKSELNVHIATHSIHDCKICGKKFNRRSSLTNHVKTHNSAVNQKEFVSEKDAEETSAMKPKGYLEKNHSCSICKKSFNSKSKLSKHTMKHHSDLPIKYCNECGKYFSSALSFDIHMRTHKPQYQPNDTKSVKPYSLELDPKGKKKYQCKRCGESYVHQESLKKHVEKEHSKIFEHYLCYVCGKLFSAKKNMLRHVKEKHSDITKKALNSNKRRFSIKDEQKAKEKSDFRGLYQCKTCKKLYSSKSSLNKHSAKHLMNKISKHPVVIRKGKTGGISHSEPKKLNPRELNCVNVKSANTKVYVCRICERHIESKSYLYKHIKRKHGIGVKQYEQKHGTLPYKVVKKHFNVIIKPTSGEDEGTKKSPKAGENPQLSQQIIEDHSRVLKCSTVTALASDTLSQEEMEIDTQNESKRREFLAKVEDKELNSNNNFNQEPDHIVSKHDLAKSSKMQAARVRDTALDSNDTDARDVALKMYICRICEKHIESKDYLYKHIKRKHGIRVKQYKQEHGILPYKVVKKHFDVIIKPTSGEDGSTRKSPIGGGNLQGSREIIEDHPKASECSTVSELPSDTLPQKEIEGMEIDTHIELKRRESLEVEDTELKSNNNSNQKPDHIVSKHDLAKSSEMQAARLRDTALDSNDTEACDVTLEMHICRICEKHVESKDNLYKHLKRKHGIGVKQYKQEHGILPYKVVKKHFDVIIKPTSGENDSTRKSPIGGGNLQGLREIIEDHSKASECSTVSEMPSDTLPREDLAKGMEINTQNGLKRREFLEVEDTEHNSNNNSNQEPDHVTSTQSFGKLSKMQAACVRDAALDSNDANAFDVASQMVTSSALASLVKVVPTESNKSSNSNQEPDKLMNTQDFANLNEMETVHLGDTALDSNDTDTCDVASLMVTSSTLESSEKVVHTESNKNKNSNQEPDNLKNTQDFANSNEMETIHLGDTALDLNDTDTCDVASLAASSTSLEIEKDSDTLANLFSRPPSSNNDCTSQVSVTGSTDEDITETDIEEPEVTDSQTLAEGNVIKAAAR
ncbi:uncharacterized protein LOC120331831 [Styela clava]